MPAVIETCPIMFSHAVTHPHRRPPMVRAQKYRPPAVGYADAISAIDAATHMVNMLKIGPPIESAAAIPAIVAAPHMVNMLPTGQPIEFAAGPANLRP